MHKLACMPIDDSRTFIYPRLFSLHDLAEDCGLPYTLQGDDDETACAGPDNIKLPAVTNLSFERFSQDAVYLLDDSEQLFMWLGRAVPPQFLMSCFSVQSLDPVDCSQLVLLQNPDSLSERVNNIVNALRSERKTYMQLHVVREGSGEAEARFSWHLVEDRASFTGGTYSYPEFLNHVTRQSQGVAH
jgi:protein transport protein SEC24